MAEQNKLNPELMQFAEQRRRSLKVVKTTTTPSGQMLDWVPIESQTPDGKVASPPPSADMPPLSGENRGPAKFEDIGERGPEGTVPIPQMDLRGIDESMTLEKYLGKKGGLRVNKNRPGNPDADPNPFGYFHATSGQSVTAYGCDGWLNVWDPEIHNSGDHSIMQCGMQNYKPKLLHSLEAGWTVDKGLNGDTIAHVFTYYTNNGYSSDGDDKGGYNRLVKGWKQYDKNIFPGARINGVSTQGGTQLGISFKYQLYQGNWWFSVQNIWLGYYPASLFPGGLNSNAEWIGFWGEVFTSLANPDQTTDQMGSGRKAETGWTHACFESNLRIQVNTAGTMAAHDGSPSAEDPKLYDIVPHMNSGTGLGSYFYAGGQAS